MLEAIVSCGHGVLETLTHFHFIQLLEMRTDDIIMRFITIY
jgi:hypothetical protein